MRVTPTAIPEVLMIEPKIFGDTRGLFYESFNLKAFQDAIGRKVEFVQDNHSRSAKNVLRGLHYQIQQPQGKLVRVVKGAVFDVAVDLRKSSSTFGRWVGAELTEENAKQMWIPPGFAHGFFVLNDLADVLYKTTDYYFINYERSILWSDSSIDIDWPLQGAPILSDKDRVAANFKDAETFD